MAKLKIVVGSAVLEVEGDESACSESARMFHLALAEFALRDVEQQIAGLRPLQKRRRDLVQQIAKLKVPSHHETTSVQ